MMHGLDVANLTESLPANGYCNPEIFRRERDRIFRRSWHFICPEAELGESGQYVASDISGQSIVVCRDQSHRLRGYLNNCRHRASPVCIKPAGKRTHFTCPYHAWSYDLDGQLLNAPGFDRDFDKTGYRLFPVRVETWNSLVFACLDTQCQRLNEWLGGAVRLAEQFPGVMEMEFHVRLSNTFMANWKNYSDNSAEGHHLATIHRDLSRSLMSEIRITAHEGGQYVGFEVVNRESGSPGYWIYKFPGLRMHLGEDSFNVERIRPLEVDQSRTDRWFWFRPEIDDRERTETVRFSNQVMQEDIEICTRVQENLQAGHYDRGVLSPEREPGTVFFQSWVRQALENE
ncbi:MAG: aromatic ring-hydroxylating dioxygenase subunit alpha [Gammaproteobacteria bacterium]|nr:aromatic ring-hydroxylating dioxygenase subunit alpha [Gammaproteobacteria bacterium]